MTNLKYQQLLKRIGKLEEDCEQLDCICEIEEEPSEDTIDHD